MTEVGEVVEKIIKREVKKEKERRNKELTLDELIKDLEEFKTLLNEIKNEGLNN